MARITELLKGVFSRKSKDVDYLMNLTLRQLREQNVYVRIENDEQLDMTYGEYLKIQKSKPAKPPKEPEYRTSIIEVDDETIASNDIQKIIEPVWWSVSIDDGEVQYEKDLKNFSKAQRYVFAIEWYTSEVNNGGHDQFYFNSTGIVWEDAMRGFEEIGAQRNVEIIRKSADRIGGNPSKDHEKRQNQMDKYEPDFEDLDEMFYDNTTDMAELLFAYIRSNAKEFYFSGEVRIPI